MGLPWALRQRFGCTPVKSRGRPPPFEPNFLQFQGLSSITSDDDEVDLRGEQPGGEPEALSAQALDPVADDGSSNPTGSDEPHAGGGALTPGLLRGDEKDEVRRHDAPRARLDANEVGSTPDAPSAVEGEARQLATGYFL
jgi:hypothetical protein